MLYLLPPSSAPWPLTGFIKAIVTRVHNNCVTPQRVLLDFLTRSTRKKTKSLGESKNLYFCFLLVSN